MPSTGPYKMVGHMLPEDQIESVEAMCEAILWLCDCDADHAGQIESSFNLLKREGVTPMSLDGAHPHPGGFRRLSNVELRRDRRCRKKQCRDERL